VLGNCFSWDISLGNGSRELISGRGIYSRQSLSSYDVESQPLAFASRPYHVKSGYSVSAFVPVIWSW
jgi:hypothetical protein